MSNEELLINGTIGQGELSEGSSETSQKYLTFKSDGINFAIAPDYVIEIINEHSPTHLPRVPDFIKGIINLRGQIIPIMDARLRMNRSETEMTRDTCVIVIDANNTTIGLLVDNVSQMMDIDTARISAPPASHQQEFVNGITHIGGEVYLMLDCESLLQM